MITLWSRVLLRKYYYSHKVLGKNFPIKDKGIIMLNLHPQFSHASYLTTSYQCLIVTELVDWSVCEHNIASWPSLIILRD